MSEQTYMIILCIHTHTHMRRAFFLLQGYSYILRQEISHTCDFEIASV